MIVGLLGGLAKHLVKRTSQLSHKSVSQLRRSPRLQKRALPSTLHSGARMCPQGHNKVSPADQNSAEKASSVLHQLKSLWTDFYDWRVTKGHQALHSKVQREGTFWFSTLGYSCNHSQNLTKNAPTSDIQLCLHFFIVGTNEKFKFLVSYSRRGSFERISSWNLFLQRFRQP